MKRIRYILFVLFAAAATACGGNKTPETAAPASDSTGKTCLKPSDRNPNGVSELAALMRTMEAQTETWKKEIEAGQAELDPVPDVYRTLKTAVPTEKEMKNEFFDGFSDDFNGYAAALVKAHKKDRKAAFNTMVGGCMNCHTQMCPGPVKRIHKFYF